MRPRVLGPVLLIVACAWCPNARGEGLISGLSVSPPFFNPSLGQKEAIVFKLAGRADVTVSILDRDLVPVRTLPTLVKVSGETRIEWDGRDDLGRVLPDEAYSLRVEAIAGNRHETYEPARGFMPTLSDPKRSYSPVSGVLRYELDTPSRVHIQAGEAVLVGNDGKRDGPVLKTIVDRAPRASGSVIETWDGFDESRTIHIPSLKNFAISILGASLPPNSIITIGSRAESFRDYISAIPGRKPVQQAHGAHGHAQHIGLNAMEDHSPELSLAVSGERDPEGRIRVSGKPLKVTVALNAKDAGLFLRPESELLLFLDEKPLTKRTSEAASTTFSIDSASIPPGEHRLTANWISSSGPVAVHATKLIVGPPAPVASGLSR